MCKNVCKKNMCRLLLLLLFTRLDYTCSTCYEFARILFFFFDLLMHMMEGTLTPICYWADEIACRHLIPASVSCGNWGKLAVEWGMQSSSLCCRPLLLFVMSCWLPRTAPAWRWAAWWSVFQSRASEVDRQVYWAVSTPSSLLMLALIFLLAFFSAQEADALEAPASPVSLGSISSITLSAVWQTA